MCELFAMSSRLPATVSFSFEEFSRHGGLSGPHSDGWGIAWYEHGDARIVREPLAAATSACVEFIQTYPFRSTLVVSHVRHATQGEVALRNTQPFSRELGGRMHLFAHNGHLPAARERFTPRTFQPVGDTDSEVVFCALLDELRDAWDGAPPSAETRRDVVARFAASLRPLGPANFIYSDGELMFLHGHRRREASGAGFNAPGLHVLRRACAAEGTLSAAGVELRSSGPQEVVLAASVPLTDEPWQPLGEGELLVADAGHLR